MRNAGLLIGFLFTVTFLPAQTPVDVQHYRFHINLSDQHDTISGIADIRHVWLSAGDRLQLDLAGVNAKGKGMLVSKVEGRGVSRFEHRDNRIQVEFQQEYKAGDTATISVHYKGIPADGLIISKTKYGNRSFFADNWPNRGHNWIPCIDVPADKATVEFIVTAPQAYQVVANGIQVEETNLPEAMKRTHWKESVPVSTKVMVIGVARFAMQLSGVVESCIPVYSWVYPEDRDKGFFDYAQAVEILPWFIDKIGPYAYGKLANVESKTIFGGLENANTIFYSESSVTGTRKSESLLVHEIAHQWFGNMATEKTFAHLWLSEGFATYMTILYMEDKYGYDTARAMLLEDRDQVIRYSKRSKSPVVDETPDYMELLNPNSYQKGGWVLHMLRRQLGDEVFWKAIREYYAAYGGKTADTEDLQHVFEKVSGKKLGAFFRQWLYTPGQPALDLEWEYNEKKKELVIHLKQNGPVFEFPLDIAVKDSSGHLSYYDTMVSGAEKKWVLTHSAPPAEIIPDPTVSLLFQATVKKRD